MKKFLKTIIIFILTITCIIAAVNGLYIYQLDKVSDTTSYERSIVAKIKNVPEHIQICNFGSSHGLNSFNYLNYSDYVCYNFGQSSQFLSYDYRILQNYLDNIDEGAIVFITISHFSFFGPPDTQYDNFKAMNKRYYSFLPDELIKEYDAKTDFYVTKCPALAAENLADLFKVLLGYVAKDEWSKTTNEETASELAANRFDIFITSKLKPSGERWYNQEEIDALYKIIELCREHNLKPILVTTPYLAEYTEFVAEKDPSFYDDFYTLIDRVTEDTGVAYYDYSQDERFNSDYSLFMDVDHLNRAGAEKFTRILLQETVGIG